MAASIARAPPHPRKTHVLWLRAHDCQVNDKHKGADEHQHQAHGLHLGRHGEGSTALEMHHAAAAIPALYG